MRSDIIKVCRAGQLEAHDGGFKFV